MDRCLSEPQEDCIEEFAGSFLREGECGDLSRLHTERE
jgi:hypothetical protein